MIPEWEVDCVFLAAMLESRHPELFRQLSQALTSHGIEVRLLKNVRDIWVADYSAIQVDRGKLVKFRYDPDYLKDQPDLKTGDLVSKCFRDLGNCRRSPIVLDGGNIVAARNKAIVTDKIYRENPAWKRVRLRDQLRQLLQIDELIVIPKEPYDPIGHADAVVRFISDDAVLVNDYSKVDPAYGHRLVQLLIRHKLEIETIPYVHERRSTAGIPSAVGCYVNFIRTKHVVVAPIFGAKTDQSALDKLNAVFHPVPVIPLECKNLAREGGVLNCIAASYRLPEGTQKEAIRGATEGTNQAI